MSKVQYIDGIEFRQVPDFPGYYVNASGDVMSYHKHGYGTTLYDKPHQLKPATDRDGYKSVILFQNKGRHAKRIHHLVLEAFVAPRPFAMQCQHLDGSPKNNCIENLAWGTSLENFADRAQYGREPRGQRAPNAKLTEVQVLAIRRIKAESNTTYKTISRQFSVGPEMVSLIVRRKRWTHI